MALFEKRNNGRFRPAANEPTVAARRNALTTLTRYGVGLVLAGWASSARAQSDATRVIDLKIEKGALIGAQDGNVVRVKEGENLVINWSADEAVKLHLHGYDVELTVGPSASATMTFEAFATGRFPISQHGFSADGKTLDKGTLGYLEVLPR